MKDITGETGSTGIIVTNPLTTTTGSGHEVAIKPEEGTQLTEFEIRSEAPARKECIIPTTTVSVTGELIGIANTEKHSHLTLEESTNGTGFKANGNTAHYEGTDVFYLAGEPERTVGLQTFE